MNFEQLQFIEGTKGTKLKMECLQRALILPDVELFIRTAYNDMIYSVSERTFEKLVDTKYTYSDCGDLLEQHNVRLKEKISFLQWDINTILRFLEELPNHTGNKAFIYLQPLLILHPTQAKWIARAIMKDLRLGLSVQSINKVLIALNKQPIKQFEVQLCGAFHIEDEALRNEKYPLLATIKYDGERGFLIKQGANVVLYSRSGKIINYVPELIEHFAKFNDDFVLDGEVVCDTFKQLSTRIGRKPPYNEVSGLAFRVFDVLRYGNVEFSGKCQYERTTFLDTFSESKYFVLEQHKYVANYEELVEYYNQAVGNKCEGIIIKRNVLYEFGSRDNWYKIKPVLEGTFIVTGFELGKGRKAGAIASLNISDKSGKLSSAVGSGLTDDDMGHCGVLNSNNKLIGHLIDVAYSELNITSTGYALRFPRFIKFRSDKNEPDSI